jgi:hypothetical protein
MESDSLALSALVSARMGISYGFKYRAKNLFGWSAFSPVSFILAANVPVTPEKPSFISATNNSITIRMYPSNNDGGSFVTSYILEMDEGEQNSQFKAV